MKLGPLIGRLTRGPARHLVGAVAIAMFALLHPSSPFTSHAAADGPAPVEHHYDVTFETENQGTFKEGDLPILDFSITPVDYDWKESETKDQTQTRAGFEFGSKSTVTAEGNVTIGLDAVSNLSGAVDLIYPVRVKVTTPAPDSFAPGDWVTITAEAEVLDGVRMETASHKTEIKIGAVMAAKVTGEGKVCNFVCSPPQELFDPVNLVETEDIIFDSTDITSRIVFPPIIDSLVKSY